MSETLTITNPYGETIQLMPSDNYRLLSLGDVAGLTYNVVTNTGYLQRGTTVTQKSLGSKLLNMTVAVLGSTQTSFRTKLADFAAFFDGEYHSVADLDMFTIAYTQTGLVDKEVKGYLQGGPSMSTTPENRLGRYQRCLLTFMLPEPLWMDTEYTTVLMESQTDLFSFPLEITDTYEFGKVSDEGYEVNNLGDTNAPIIITFEGTSTNPVIENVTYGEKLKLNTTLSFGDTIEINTDYKNPSVLIISGGTTTSGYQYIDATHNDLDITLRRGINEVKYTSDDTSKTSAILKYKRHWLSPYSGAV